jgi:hypothetical protein
MSGQKTVQIETRKRGVFGKIVKFLFIAFNILMIVWLGSYWANLGNTLNGAADDAYKAGAAIGGSIGSVMIFVVWALGDIVLGIGVMVTRGKKIITTMAA